MSLRDTILGAKDLNEELLTIPEWDGVTILITGMTGKQRMQLTEAADRQYMYADLMMVLCLDPDTREPVFDPADREALSDKSGDVLERVTKAIMELSGGSIDDAEVEVEKDPI